MNENDIQIAVGRVFNGAMVRAKETSGGWLIEIIHQQYGVLGASTFRRQIEQILNAVPNPNPPAIIWKIFLYSDEQSRYLGQGTLHTIPSSYENNMHTTTLSGSDAYLDIPEFDTELISFNDYRQHLIPALESIDARGVAILPYQPVQYQWLEAIGGEYAIQNVQLAGNLNGRRRINVQL